MLDRGFHQRSRISVVGTTGTSAALNGDIIDMAGFESILGIAYQSASQADAQLIFQMGTATDALSDATGLVRGTKTALYLNVDRPLKRYCRFVLEPGSATIAYESLVTIAYGARSLPTSHPVSTTGNALYSPGSGTASG